MIKELRKIIRNGEVRRGPLLIYFRKSRRVLNGNWVNTIDVARVSCNEPGQGIFTRTLHDIECYAAGVHSTVYVENVIDERFRDFFRRRGYTECEGGFGTSSFYLERK